MKILRIGVLGASGYVGARLCGIAEARGHAVTRFSRAARSGFRVLPPSGPPDLSGLDAVVNLAGEPILGLWTADKRKKILESRVNATSQVSSALASLPGGPRVLVNASAIGYYGDTGETAVSESSPSGTGFLAETCRAWEAATTPATAAGIRVVRLRIGFVVGPGGAMKLILPVFRLGLGGNLGDGRQWMSCIHVDDVAGLILWALGDESIEGAVNAVMPQPVRNAGFTKAVAAAVRRPAILPAPAFALRIALGDLSSLMLDSARVLPSVAVSNGYPYDFPDLITAVRQ